MFLNKHIEKEWSEQNGKIYNWHHEGPKQSHIFNRNIPFDSNQKTVQGKHQLLDWCTSGFSSLIYRRRDWDIESWDYWYNLNIVCKDFDKKSCLISLEILFCNVGKISDFEDFFTTKNKIEFNWEIINFNFLLHWESLVIGL